VVCWVLDACAVLVVSSPSDTFIRTISLYRVLEMPMVLDVPSGGTPAICRKHANPAKDAVESVAGLNVLDMPDDAPVYVLSYYQCVSILNGRGDPHLLLV
jgi:hypothetical protein